MSDQEFHRLVEEHYDRLFRAARFLCGGTAAAEELVQETFLAAAGALGRFRRRSSTYTWLYGILLNKFRRWVRQRRASLRFMIQEEGCDELADLAQRLEDNQPGPAETAYLKETAELVRKAIDTLPPDHRAVIAMRYVEGLSYQEIAQVLGCPLGTVKSRIHYALQKIAQELRAYGEGS